MTGRHSRGEDYARVLCCCGHRIVSMSWDQFHQRVPALCEHPDCDGTLTVYVTRDPGDPPLWHLSITHQPNNQRSAGRYPTWDEIANARDQFLPADRSFVMRLPAADEYVAIHSTCFHLHEEATQ